MSQTFGALSGKLVLLAVIKKRLLKIIYFKTKIIICISYLSDSDYINTM